MPLPCTPPISMNQVFKEVYGRDPNPTEAHTLEQLTLASTLSNKAAPYDLLRFLCYTHTLLTIAGDWLYALQGSYENSLVEVPRKVMRRVSGTNTTFTVDTGGQQTHALSRDRWGMHFIVTRHRVYAYEHNAHVFYSDDKGQSWTFLAKWDALSEGSVQSCLVPHSLKDDLTAVPWGTVYFSDIRGNVRHVSPQGTVTTVRTGNGVFPNVRYVPGAPVSMRPDGAYLFTSQVDSGGNCLLLCATGLPTSAASWTTVASYTGWGQVTGVFFSRTNVLQGVAFGLFGQLLRTSNGGHLASSWTSFSTGLPGLEGINWLDGAVLSAGDTLLVVGHLDDGGYSSLVRLPFAAGGPAPVQYTLPAGITYAHRVRVVSDTSWYIFAGWVWHSADGGSTWNQVGLGTSEVVHDMVQLSAIADPAASKTLAGFWSARYDDQGSACMQGNPTTAVYSTNGTANTGDRMYYDSAGTSLLPTGYYSSGEWVYHVDASGYIIWVAMCGGMAE